MMYWPSLVAISSEPAFCAADKKWRSAFCAMAAWLIRANIANLISFME
jgi:hypothetical protein